MWTQRRKYMTLFLYGSVESSKSEGFKFKWEIVLAPSCKIFEKMDHSFLLISEDFSDQNDIERKLIQRRILSVLKRNKIGSCFTSMENEIYQFIFLWENGQLFENNGWRLFILLHLVNSSITCQCAIKHPLHFSLVESLVKIKRNLREKTPKEESQWNDFRFLEERIARNMFKMITFWLKKTCWFLTSLLTNHTMRLWLLFLLPLPPLRVFLISLG